ERPGEPAPPTGSRPGVAVPAGLVPGELRAQDERDDVVRVEVLQALALHPRNHVVGGSRDEGRVYAGGIQKCPEGFENCHARLYTTKRPLIRRLEGRLGGRRWTNTTFTPCCSAVVTSSVGAIIIRPPRSWSGRACWSRRRHRSARSSPVPC